MNMPSFARPEEYDTIQLAMKARMLAMFAVLILVSACASTQPNDSYSESKSRKAAESNTSLGLEYMNRGQYEVALGKLKKAIKEDPGYAPAHTVLAVLYERIGETGLAANHYKKAYEADPTDGDVNNNYGTYLCQSGKADRAFQHFNKALEDPFYSSPWVALTNAGSCALGSGDQVAADEYLRRALKIDPGFPDALINMAELNYKQKDYLKARAFMQRFEAAGRHGPESLLLAFRIETASSDSRAANKYKLTLETNFPEADQTAEVRRISEK